MSDVANRNPGTAARRRTVACLTVLALAAFAWLAAPQGAAAQVVAMVNGEPITALDVTQRIRLIQLSTKKSPSRQEALDELIDDKLKVQLAKRYIAEIPERDVENAFSNVARRVGLSPQQFAQVLQQNGIGAQAFKSRLRSDIVWGSIIRGKFQGQLQVGDRDVTLALQSKSGDSNDGKAGDGQAYDYSLRPILLLVPRGSSPGAFESRRREAEGLRQRFQSCAEGLAMARTLRDVAIRAPITRSSADFAQQQREVLANTPIGRLTPPDTTPQGVELFAVCAKTPAKNADTASEREARDQIYNKRFQELSKNYLKELRRSALIELR
ncbi:MAG: SurA N-terminal domain-containing protein [Xanthobacteraceae bacterium]|nr:SurA N-terminal domain-containing protein [Xanthobacteraceae bacterium]PWB60071.1 MAG: SurA N- domain family protein [Bradyrhizobiaceae bacterium]